GGQEEEEVGGGGEEPAGHSHSGGGETLTWRRRRQPRRRRSSVASHGGGGWRPPTAYNHTREGSHPLPLCLNDLRDLSGLQAAGAHADTLSLAAHHGPHRHQIRQPASLRQLVGVAD